MKIDAQTLLVFAEGLLAIAEQFNPKAAGSIKEVIDAGAELNGLIKQIKDQTQEEAPEVWAQVSSDFNRSLSAFQASVDAHSTAAAGEGEVHGGGSGD